MAPTNLPILLLGRRHGLRVSAGGLPPGVSGGVSTDWVIDYWSGQSIPLFPAANLEANVPVISPDGQSLAVILNNNDNIDTVSLSDGVVTPITQYQSNLLETDDCAYSCANSQFISWSPDSTRVTWIASASVPDDGVNTAYTNVWVSDLDGGPTRLTDFNSGTIQGDPDLFGAQWSPDGTSILFVSNQVPGSNTLGNSNLWTANVSTGDLFCVTNFSTEFHIDAPSYAPGTSTIVFASSQSPDLSMTSFANVRNLFAIHSDGTDLVALTTSPVAWSEGGYWAPDGKTLLFESDIDPADPTQTLTDEQGIWQTTLSPGAVPSPINIPPMDNWDYSPTDDDD